MFRRGLRLVPVLLLALAAPAGAQVDPLLFLKDASARPNVLIALDLSSRMQFDGRGTYYDPHVYTLAGEAWEEVLGVHSGNTARHYRRRVLGLVHVDSPGMAAASIEITGDLEAIYGTLDARTRLGVARFALGDVVRRNRDVARFGLVPMRQLDAAVPADPVTIVRVGDPAEQEPTDTGAAAAWRCGWPEVGAPNGALTARSPALVAAESLDANEALLRILARPVTEPGALLPAGVDSAGSVDAPLGALLADAFAEASRLIELDPDGVGCRNTILVLVTGGADGDTTPLSDPIAQAARFADVGARRVPVYVVALAPQPAASAALRAVARAGGGQYAEITPEMMDAADTDLVVAEVSRALEAAVQHAFAAPVDLAAPPGPGEPFGRATSFQVAGPVVATIDLQGAVGLGGIPLPDTVVVTPGSGAVVPQRANVVIAGGFSLPGEVGQAGFNGRLAAFRVYRPEADPSRASGYRFVADGTPLWVARTPASAARNIFTVTPEGEMIAFRAENSARLAPWLATADAPGLIDEIRASPLGAIIGSTPAVLEPPALDPPPGPSYRAFAAALSDRRTLVFVGANDGMLHAFDGRTGLEVWAFVPFNLLPKLRALRRGQAVGDFAFFVDGSPKIADLRVDDDWHTVLIVGQAGGGTFYQAFDVTLADVARSVGSHTDDTSALLGYFSDPAHLAFRWSFPDYRRFDWTLAPYGELRADATDVEKTVGETWSVPAIVELEQAPGRFVALVGSGWLSPAIERGPSRFPAPSVRAAGTTFYMLDAWSGAVLDSRDVGSDGVGEAADCRALGDCGQLKNALHAAPAAIGRGGPTRASAAYIGDLDGRLWRFDLGTGAAGTPAIAATRRVYAGGDGPIVWSLALDRAGSAGPVLVFGTGSDRLPLADAPSIAVAIADEGNGDAGRVVFRVVLAGGAASPVEHVTAAPVIAGDVVFFASTARPSGACAVPTASIQAIGLGGGMVYDTNGDGALDDRDTRRILEVRGAVTMAAFAIDRHLFVAAGDGIDVLGDARDYNVLPLPMSVRVLTWRERR